MNIPIVNNTDENRFEWWIDEQVAFVDYAQSDDEQITFFHTEVPPSLEGRGIGSGLAKHVLDYAKKYHLKVHVLCPFIKTYIKRHPDDYQELTFVQ